MDEDKKSLKDLVSGPLLGSRKTVINSVIEALSANDVTREKKNARKAKGANEAVTKQLLLAALYKQGFITKLEKGFRIDLSGKIEKMFGDNGKKNGTTENVREILETLVRGLKAQGIAVEVFYVFTGETHEKK